MRKYGEWSILGPLVPLAALGASLIGTLSGKKGVTEMPKEQKTKMVCFRFTGRQLGYLEEEHARSGAPYSELVRRAIDNQYSKR